MTDEERSRLRRAFDRLPKVPEHGESVSEQHNRIPPEWIMDLIAAPHERYNKNLAKRYGGRPWRIQ